MRFRTMSVYDTLSPAATDRPDLSADESKETNLAAQTYERLLEMLLGGDLGPGSILQERRLAAALKVSRTPLREAMNRLEAKGLVTRHAGRFITVAIPDVRSVAEVFNVRRILEAETTRNAAGRLSPTRADALRGRLWDMLASGTPTPAQSWAVDNDVHAAIAEAAQNAFAAELIEDLRRRTHIYNAHGIPERLRPSVLEHLALIDAVVAGDADRAAELMTTHLDNAKVAALSQRLRGRTTGELSSRS
jgi:DNA-binding GntR family transcriptional regulator